MGIDLGHKYSLAILLIPRGPQYLVGCGRTGLPGKKFLYYQASNFQEIIDSRSEGVDFLYET
jgi:hypothetical protein